MSIDLAYAELGLQPGAGESEVKAAWRRLVSRWHPDRNKSADAAELIQRINRAYEQIRSTVFAEAPAAASTARRERGTTAAPARTLRRKLRLTLEDAALGCVKLLRGRYSESCAPCAGSGISPSPVACAACDGSGSIRVSAWFGWLSSRSTCSACEGRGSFRPACPACAGEGQRHRAYRRTVRLPAGVRQGDLLQAAPSGSDGDEFDGALELQIDIAAHALFEAGGDGALHCRMPVDGFAWIANAWIDVPTPAGLQQMRLRRGRQSYRLRGQGLPLERGGIARGDLLVTIEPVFPDAPNEAQQALIDQLARSSAAGSDRPAGPLRNWQRSLRTWERERRAAPSAG